MGHVGPNPIFLKKVVDTYKEFLGERLVSIVLFGSRARGDASESSDYDFFIIAEDLPEKLFKRKLFIRRPLKGQFKEKLSITAKTPGEMANSFPSLFLDLSLDGLILYDKEGFFEHLQKKIKNIISQAGLQRRKDREDYYWEWQRPPKGGWEITWSGYREL